MPVISLRTGRLHRPRRPEVCAGHVASPGAAGIVARAALFQQLGASARGIIARFWEWRALPVLPIASQDHLWSDLAAVPDGASPESSGRRVTAAPDERTLTRSSQRLRLILPDSLDISRQWVHRVGKDHLSKSRSDERHPEKLDSRRWRALSRYERILITLRTRVSGGHGGCGRRGRRDRRGLCWAFPPRGRSFRGCGAAGGRL